MSHLWGGGGHRLVFGLALYRRKHRGAATRARGPRDSRLVGRRIAWGWLIVEDLVTVLALVLLPALAHHCWAPCH